MVSFPPCYAADSATSHLIFAGSLILHKPNARAPIHATKHTHPLLLIHPSRLPRPLCRASCLSLHVLMREPPPVGARLRIVALGVPLLTTKTELVVLLLALEVAALAAAALGLFRFVKRDVEEVFFVGGSYIGAGAFWDR